MLVELVIDGWRFAKLFSSALRRMQPEDAARYVNQHRYFLKRLDEILASDSMKLIDLEGEVYEPGMAVTALNIDEFAPEDKLVVEQMVEPLIMGPDGVVQVGTVILRTGA